MLYDMSDLASQTEVFCYSTCAFSAIQGTDLPLAEWRSRICCAALTTATMMR